MDGQKLATGDGSVSERVHPYATMEDATHDDTREKMGRTRRRRVTVFGFCCLIVTLISTISLIILAHWLILHPKNGNYNLVDATVRLFNLTHPTSASPHYELTNTDIDLHVMFANTNEKIAFDIKHITVQALYATEELGYTTLPAFHQPRKNDTILATTIKVRNKVLSDPVGDALRSDVEHINSTVTLHVVVNAKVRNNHVGIFQSLHPYRTIRLTCASVFNLTGPGSYPTGSYPAVNGTTSASGTMIRKSCSVKQKF